MSNADPLSRDEGPEPEASSRASFSAHGTPVTLKTAAAVTLVQGLLTFGFGVTEALNIDVDRLVMGVTTGVFFLAYGAGLSLCAWGLVTMRQWSRGPVLFAQLVWFGLAWNFRTGATLPIAVGLAGAATVVLFGLLHPRSVEALERAANRA